MLQTTFTMYSKTINWLTAILAISLFISCSKDTDTSLEPINNIPPPIEQVSSTIYGVIIDEAEEPIEGALVKLDMETTTTDVNGYFKVSGIFNSRGAHMTASKEGYFASHGKVIPYADLSVGTKMMLVIKENKQ